MKKLIFSLSILALTFASCSKEEASLIESNTSTTAFTFKSSSVDTKIDEFYSAMLNSKEYNDYDNARTVFFAKMHFGKKCPGRLADKFNTCIPFHHFFSFGSKFE